MPSAEREKRQKKRKSKKKIVKIKNHKKGTGNLEKKETTVEYKTQYKEVDGNRDHQYNRVVLLRCRMRVGREKRDEERKEGKRERERAESREQRTERQRETAKGERGREKEIEGET